MRSSYSCFRGLSGATPATIAVVLLAGLAIGQCGLGRAAANSFRNVEATDGTFSVTIPAEWHVQADQVSRFGAWGGEGQSVAWGMLSFIDRAHYQQYQGLVGPYLARQVYPSVSDPLPPRVL
jgi:hypothetical protein